MSGSQKSRPMTEAELVAAACSGDEDAFKALYESHREYIGRAVHAILGRNDLDDVIQDAFVFAWRGLKDFRGDSTFRTWVTSIARNRCSAGHGQSKMSCISSADLSADQERSYCTDHRSSEVMEARYELSRLMSSLPSQSRELLEMNLEGLSDKEIASAKALSLRAVRGRLQRARDEMREKVSGSAEQSASASSLISEKTIPRGGGTQKMATPDKKKRRHLKTRAPEAADSSGESPEQGHAIGIPTDAAEPGQDATSVPFSFDDLVAEVEQLEYLSAIEARRQFESEIVREAEDRLRGSIRSLLIERGGDPGHEEGVFRRVVRAVSAIAIVREDLARLQQLRMGVHSREIRLWYFETVAQHLIPGAVDDVLREAEMKVASPVSGGADNA
jgi:RNA polymerase sigma-70 factor, ECF subfamily